MLTLETNKANVSVLYYVGPIILLELCDQSLTSWLKKIQKVTDDVEDNMINFCTDIARGMSHLHETGVSKRIKIICINI